MRKKMVFMVINMNVGGTEKALLNMIREMPANKFDITLLMLEEYGGFLNSIPEHVHVQYISEYANIKTFLNKPPRKVISDIFRQRDITKGVNFTVKYVLSKITKNRNILLKYLLKGVPDVEEEYDVAVAYAGPMDFISYFVVKKIRAKRKIQWIHFDVTKIGFNIAFAKRNYKLFDKIFFVSVEAQRKFTIKIPELKDRSDVFLNMVSPSAIFKESNNGQGFKDVFNGLRILTVGRLATEKGQDMAVRVLSRLITSGYNVKWYCVGEGSFRHELEEMIGEYKLEDQFILLGPEMNPYTYMKQCDIYVQPSRYEGYCITLTEAIYLSKPIISTDVTGAKEQIIGGKTGLIVGIQEDELYRGIQQLINNEQLRRTFTNNLKGKAPYHSENVNKLLNVSR